MKVSNGFYSLDRMADAYLSNQTYVKKQSDVDSNPVVAFQDILQSKQKTETNTTDLVFSKPAHERLANRNIELNEEQMNRLNKGVMQAKEKSIQESLVMMDNIAFIVNVKNNTVVTAMDQNTNINNVFTNIDGAVIV